MSKKNTKKMGIKQVFKISKNQSLVFGYGEKNSHKIDKELSDKNDIIEINKESKFDLIKKGEKNLDAKKKDSTSDLSATILNPCFSKENNIFKNEIERIFYNITPENENEIKNNSMYIQIASNIFDINKIISPYINEIVSSLNNALFSKYYENNQDFIGNLKYCKIENEKKEELGKILQNNPLKYYDYIFKNNFKKNDIYLEEVYNFFTFLSLIRQTTFHFKNFDHFKINEIHQRCQDSVDMEKFINEVFSRKSKIILNSYEKNNLNTNFLILNKIYGNKIEEIFKSFYDYVILEKGKYLGFSVKKIREEIIKKILTEEELEKEDVSSKKRKINLFFDFRIYLEFNEKNSIIEEIKEILRENGGSDKDIYLKIFEKYFRKDLKKYEKDLSLILEKSNYNNKINKNKNNNNNINNNFVHEQQKIFNKYNMFSKALFVMALFLDNKEANDLLTTITNKLDNISSFMNIKHNSKKIFNADYTKSDFKIFMESSDLSDQIKVVKRFINMLNIKNKEKKNEKNPALIGQISYLEDFLQLFFNEVPVFIQKSKNVDLKPIRDVIDVFNIIDFISTKEVIDLDKVYINKKVISRENYISKLNEFRDIIFSYSEGKKLNISFDEFKKELNDLINVGTCSSFIDYKKEKELRKTNKLRLFYLNSKQTNLVLNSILNSNFFLYLMKHMSPDKTFNIIGNKDIVINVLKQLSKNEVDRIIFSINKNDSDKLNLTYDEKLEFLYNEIQVSKIKSFFTNSNIINRMNSSYINIIELHIKVLYLVFKNLINVNFRYSTAIYMLERDIIFSCMKKISSVEDYNLYYYQEGKNHVQNHRIKEKYNNSYISPIIFPDTYIQNFSSDIKDELVENSRKKYGYYCLNEFEKNKDPRKDNKPIKNSKIDKNKIDYSNSFFRNYRNSISHLSIINYCKNYSKYFKFHNNNLKHSNIYFQLYHAVMTSYLSNQIGINYFFEDQNLIKLKEIFDDTNKENVNIEQLNKFKSIFAYDHFKNNFNEESIKENEKTSFEKFKKGTLKIINELKKANDKGTYSKKILSILNVPFSYNKARYNNLTYEHLFDKNIKLKDEDLNDEK